MINWCRWISLLGPISYQIHCLYAAEKMNRASPHRNPLPIQLWPHQPHQHFTLPPSSRSALKPSLSSPSLPATLPTSSHSSTLRPQPSLSSAYPSFHQPPTLSLTLSFTPSLPLLSSSSALSSPHHLSRSLPIPSLCHLYIPLHILVSLSFSTTSSPRLYFFPFGRVLSISYTSSPPSIISHHISPC